MLKLQKLDPSEITSKLPQLSKASQVLNNLSDELVKQVAGIEASLNKFNLGVSTYVVVSSSADEEGLWSQNLRLAYGKDGGKWGLIIERVTEDLRYGPEDTEYESWPFKDAPRELRLKVVDKIPLLLQALIKESEEVATQVRDAVAFTTDLAISFAQSSPESKK